jgi:RNA-directed DNA polymerase
MKHGQFPTREQQHAGGKTHTLGALRDMLLPKLLSGELSIADTKINRT